ERGRLGAKDAGRTADRPQRIAQFVGHDCHEHVAAGLHATLLANQRAASSTSLTHKFASGEPQRLRESVALLVAGKLRIGCWTGGLVKGDFVKSALRWIVHGLPRFPGGWRTPPRGRNPCARGLLLELQP